MKLLSDQVTEREITIILREFERVLSRSIPGDVVELGCYVGTTSVFLAEKLAGSERKLWLYDSFDGLPEKTSEDRSPAGEQFKAGELHATRKQLEKNLRIYARTKIRIKKAWFSDLNEQDVPDKIAFAFLDGDYYQSIMDSLQLVWPHLAPGATVVVDDYMNEALPGAAKAVDEWARQYGCQVSAEQSLAILHKK